MSGPMDAADTVFAAVNRALGDVVRKLADAALDGGSTDLYWRLAAEQARSLFVSDAVVCFERLADQRAVVRAAVGAAPMLTAIPVPIAPDSQAAFVYRTDAPVIVPNLQEEPRFRPGAIMVNQGFLSSISCRIGNSEEPLGIIGVFSRELDKYGAADAATLHVLASALDVGLMHLRRTFDLERRAYTDELTGIANRASIIGALDSSVENDTVKQFRFVLMVDLDGFKGVNDKLGHEIGDEVLRHVARRLSQAIGPNNLVGRLGGDEFLILIREESEEVVRLMAEQMIGLVERVMLIGGATVEISASVGMVPLGGAASATVLLRSADRAMYTAKAGGRGRVEVASLSGASLGSTRIGHPADRGDGVDLALVDAVIKSVTVDFQAMVDAQTHQVVGLSALARGPEGSPLALPARLFGVAETFGRLASLEIAAKRAAFSNVAPEGCALFVKIDPAVMVNGDAIGQIIDAWQQSGIPNRIVVELSARAMTGSPGRLLRSIERCRAIGWSIALDDVGSRSESLTALRIARPEIVKLDPQLVQHDGKPFIGPTMAALADYARHHTVRVVAKGVETAEHEAAAEFLGVHLLQGFRFGTPGPIGLQQGGPLKSTATTSADWWSEPLNMNQDRVATKRQLVGLSRYVESCAFGSDSVVLALLQRNGNYTARTKRQYAALARRFGVVGVVGCGIPAGIVDGVKHGQLPTGSPLERCWQVIVLSSTSCLALLAEEIDDATPSESAATTDWTTPRDTRFRFRLTSRTSEVEAAARVAMGQL